MGKTHDHYILILCGGSGPRLWPLSRASKPKQFLKIFGDHTLIDDTYKRFIDFIPKSNIYFVSNQKYLPELLSTFGHSVPKSNFISEPTKKNTAMAILLGMSVIKKINPLATITVTPADHYISKNLLFQKDLNLAYTLASKTHSIVTIGIKPTFPNPSFGYIIPNQKIKKHYTVTKFVEKPNVIDANLYLKRNAFWNSGIYSFSINTLEDEFKKLQPNYFELYQKLISSPSLIKSTYNKSEPIAIDKAISEYSSNLIMLPARFIWSDIGEWGSIWKQLTKDKNGIGLINNNQKFINQNSKNCIIDSSSQKLVGIVGLNNLAIIDTKDALLVCDLNNSYSVRELVSQIVSNPSLKKYFLKNNDQ